MGARGPARAISRTQLRLKRAALPPELKRTPPCESSVAHIFKQTSEAGKGIVVFTHKEADWARSCPQATDALRYMRHEYLLGVHYGHLTSKSRESWEEFCMGVESTVTFTGEPPYRIPFNSRVFTPEWFRPRPEVGKFWDVINVSRNLRLKRLDAFLLAVRRLYDRGMKSRVLLVCPTSSNETPDRNFVDLVDAYRDMFSSQERERFTVMRLGADLDHLGISNRTVAHFYNSSKVFCLLSPHEGESRVIHEALLSGLAIVTYRGLQGGGRDYLDESNCVSFDDYERVDEALMEAVARHAELNTDPDRHADELREDRTVPRLVEYFADLCASCDLPFDAELLNIDRVALRLPAHWDDVPWRGEGPTADIRSVEQLFRLVDQLEWN